MNKTHIIDLDADPYLPKDWKIIKHRRGGQWQFNAKEIELYLVEDQKNGKKIQGSKLRQQLKDQPVLNANVLDWLLKEENQYLIPEGWKTKLVFFWGTIYEDAGGSLGVRCLGWDDGGGWDCDWYWDWYWLGLHWLGHFPAALLASSDEIKTPDDPETLPLELTINDQKYRRIDD